MWTKAWQIPLLDFPLPVAVSRVPGTKIPAARRRTEPAGVGSGKPWRNCISETWSMQESTASLVLLKPECSETDAALLLETGQMSRLGIH
jgi:hypothetical protein